MHITDRCASAEMTFQGHTRSLQCGCSQVLHYW